MKKDKNLKLVNLITRTVLDYINNIYIKYNINSYLVSFSGGLDSTVLLNIIYFLKEKIIFNLKIRAIHINHNINCNSNKWEYHCINECDKKNINLIIKNIKINSNNIKKYGIEFSARKIRFNEILKNKDEHEIVLMAHNKNDKIETFFLSLKRGSGPLGLSSIKNFNIIYGFKILRPLLNFSRFELEIYAKYFNLKWIEDNSNIDCNIDRNFIRQKIIYNLEKKWPSFIKTASRSIDLCYEQEKLIEYILNKKIKNIIKSDLSLNISDLKDENEFYIKYIIKYWIKKININNLSFSIINEIYKEIISKNINYLLRIKLYNYIYVRRYKNHLFCVNENINIKPYKLILNNKNNLIYLPYKLGYLKLINDIKKENININKNYKINSIQKIRKKNFNESISIQICNYSNKKKIEVENFNKKKCIKNIFQEYKIPLWKRKITPMLFYNEKLISIIGIIITKEGIPKDKNIINLIWYIK